MSNETTVMKQTYDMRYKQLEQQMGSEMQDKVMREMVEGDYKNFDFISKNDMTEVFTRNADTVNENTDFQRRKMFLRRFTFAPLVDAFDQLAMIKDPTSDISMSGLSAAGRQKDKLLAEAAFGTTLGGYDGTTSYTFDTVNSVVAVDTRDSGAGATGLNIAKLRAARTKFNSFNVSKRLKKYIAVTAAQIDDLLAEDSVTSSDYAKIKALVDGEVNSFMGFTFVEINDDVGGEDIIPTDGDDYRRCFAWAEDGLVLGIGKDIKTDIQFRADKNNSWQVWHEMFIGAIRSAEKKVIELKCSE